MIYDVIGSLLVLIEKLLFFYKTVVRFYYILNSVSKSLFFLIYLHKFEFLSWLKILLEMLILKTWKIPSTESTLLY